MLAFCGKLPPFRILAYAGLLNGEVKAIGGIGFRPDGGVILFFDCGEGGREAAPVTIGKVGRLVMADVHRLGVPLVTAESDEDIPASGRFLEWLGFRHVGEGEYVYENRKR